MKTLLLASAMALAVTTYCASPASAVEVEFYKASTDFAREIGTCYENMPSMFKSRMYGARVLVAGNNKIISGLQRKTNAPKSDVAKFANPAINGAQFVAITYRGVPNIQPRTMMFNEAALDDETPAFRCHTVAHEMMHLFDMGPSIEGDLNYMSSISHKADFLAAFNADKQGYEKWLEWLKVNHPEQVNMVRGRLIYFFSDPMEAFAEAGANLINPLPDDEARGRNSDMKNSMKRINVYLEIVLRQAGVLTIASLPEVRAAKGQEGAVETPTLQASEGKGFFIGLPIFRIRFIIGHRSYAPRRHYYAVPHRNSSLKVNSSPKTRDVEDLKPNRLTVPAKG